MIPLLQRRCGKIMSHRTGTACFLFMTGNKQGSVHGCANFDGRKVGARSRWHPHPNTIASFSSPSSVKTSTDFYHQSYKTQELCQTLLCSLFRKGRLPFALALLHPWLLCFCWRNGAVSIVGQGDGDGTWWWEPQMEQWLAIYMGVCIKKLQKAKSQSTLANIIFLSHVTLPPTA